MLLPLAGLLRAACLAGLVTATAAHAGPDTAHRAEERAGGPVIGCTSLANLRAANRQSEGNTLAMLALVSDPRSDLGCAVVDPERVTAIADQINLNGSAYDCLTLKRTAICHWVVAGAITPGSVPAPTIPARTASPKPAKR